MLGRVIFCVVIAAAILAVVLLATVSPVPHRSAGRGKSSQGHRAITVYIHPAASAGSARRQRRGPAHEDEQVASAMVFRHQMTSGPEITSRSVGAASGFVLPGDRGSAVMSVFDTVHLAFDAPGLFGSLCVEAARSKKASPRRAGDGEEVLRVVGGTGSFAFAHGHAVVRAERRHRLDGGGASSALRLELSVTSAG
ncbi:dirigent protein 2-like [Lolium rigidum]|uniref:dirigent protein 2-like n=1 Tax=Lolium rigidum TaxID=89674 RepID=UPI001F5CECA0|nr:dirigent protein 2-like [Lolium rigidum]